ncbi:MAG: oligosaccharide repeat unit polymerase [Lachnospiraceae bacterium]|nr:oligosaccharide repeat unit polymerase [Lachnospiraceae bacterium]
MACLKLSRLSAVWEVRTWVCLYLAWILFLAGHAAVCAAWEKRSGAPARGADAPPAAGSENVPGDCGKPKAAAGSVLSADPAPQFAAAPKAALAGGAGHGFGPADAAQERTRARLLRAEIVLLALCWAALLAEIAILRFIPLFSPEPHAYSAFHVSGLHYVTVSCVLVPALSVLHLRTAGAAPERRTLALHACLTAAALLIPVLCVSRFQLVFAVGLAAVCAVLAGGKMRPAVLAGGGLALLAVYVLLTVARRHDVAYLNGIFEMKNEATPIFITQPYIYVTNNFENFNVLVRDLPAFAHGLRQLFPVFAFTGLKFLHPEWVTLPLYTTKWELTTLTLIYDAYYDFGTAGVAVFALAAGALCGAASLARRRGTNPVRLLLYAQAALYLCLSFFTTWLSNPTTWFYLGVTALLWLYVGGVFPGRCRKQTA